MNASKIFRIFSLSILMVALFVPTTASAAPAAKIINLKTRQPAIQVPIATYRVGDDPVVEVFEDTSWDCGWYFTAETPGPGFTTTVVLTSTYAAFAGVGDAFEDQFGMYGLPDDPADAVVHGFLQGVYSLVVHTGAGFCLSTLDRDAQMLAYAQEVIGQGDGRPTYQIYPEVEFPLIILEGWAESGGWVANPITTTQVYTVGLDLWTATLGDIPITVTMGGAFMLWHNTQPGASFSGSWSNWGDSWIFSGVVPCHNPQVGCDFNPDSVWVYIPLNDILGEKTFTITVEIQGVPGIYQTTVVVVNPTPLMYITTLPVVYKN